MKKVNKFIQAAAIMAALLTAACQEKVNREELCMKGEGERAIAACAMLASTADPALKAKYILMEVKHHERAGDLAEAQGDLLQIAALRDSGAIEPAWFQGIYAAIVKISVKLGRMGEAYKYAGLLVAGGSNDMGMRILVAQGLSAQGDAQGALNMLAQLGVPGPEYGVRYYKLLGEIYHGMNDHGRAGRALMAEAQAARTPAEVEEANIRLMFNALLLGNFAAAEAALDRAIAAQPGCNKVYMDAELELSHQMVSNKGTITQRQLMKLMGKIHEITRTWPDNCS